MTDTPNPFARYVTDEAIRAAFAVNHHPDAEPSTVEYDKARSALLAALAIVGPEIRREALEEAAEIFDAKAAAHERLATRLPNGAASNGPAIAADACHKHAAAIRALGKEG